MPVEDPILTVEERLDKLEASRLETVHDAVILESFLEALIEAARTALKDWRQGEDW